MKAVLFNSGMGSRMEALTSEHPKCMVKLYNGETVLERQIRILSLCGIREFVITTGPFREQIERVAQQYPELKFTFVHNEDYQTTNYIVSMDKAAEFMKNDVLLLHGDLVFNKNLVLKILHHSPKSVCIYNEKKELPQKDFKASFSKDKEGNLVLKKVSVQLFEAGCYAFQPFYKLCKKDIGMWLERVHEFVENGVVNVYAENALNEITDEVAISGVSYADDYIDEIDNEEDYQRVDREIQCMDAHDQIIEETDDYAKALCRYVYPEETVFLVCGKKLKENVLDRLTDCCKAVEVFDDFTANPKYEDIMKGVALFRRSNCRKIIAVGGGSTLDVAKCIKLFSALDREEDFFDKHFNYSTVPLIAVPTTAGTGSESTQIAVIYVHGEKQSIDHASILPDVALLDAGFLRILPEYQKKTTMMDALCQAIESFWAIGATQESKMYATTCIQQIMENHGQYLAAHETGKKDTSDATIWEKKMLLAANYSGRAIHISRTTAPHSMSYKLTTLYGISHGHAVALSLIPCWKLLHKKSYTDEKLAEVLMALAKVLLPEKSMPDISESISLVENLISTLELPGIRVKPEDLEELVNSVNLERMSNNPVCFTKEELYQLYRQFI